MSEEHAGQQQSKDSDERATRILVVDDEPSYRDYLELFLKRRGHEVRTAATGREAIEIGREFQPDILLADWMLKNQMHGLEVGETLRKQSPQLKILLMTGFPSSEIREEARRARIDHFLEKPFGLEDVSIAIDDVVERSREERRADE